MVEGLFDIVQSDHWKADNGTFKSGYLNQLERFIETCMPGLGMKAQPYIESRLKILKRQYHVINEMLGPTCNGFG